MDEVFKKNEQALKGGDNFQDDDDIRATKAALLPLFDKKLDPWPHQVAAIIRLEKELRMLEEKSKTSGAQTLPTVVLGQLGCGLGKSVILAILARYMASLNETTKVLVCTPSNWVTH